MGDLGSIPGSEDPLEKGMVTRFSILAWRMPWTEEPGGLQSKESQRVRHSVATKLSFFGGWLGQFSCSVLSDFLQPNGL